MNSIQTNWIEEKLDQSEASINTDMVFAFLHHPGHSELWPDGNNSFVQNDVIPLLQQYPKTQLLAYGHSHNYERGTVESMAENNNGDYYIMLTGGAGSGLDRWGMYPNQTNYSELMMSLDHYCFNIVDIDLNSKTMELYTFSLGHLDKPLDCVLIDQYHRYLLQEAPETPLTLSPNSETGLQPLMVASEMIGADSLMTSHFQITATPGDYSNLIAESKRDWVDIYGDTGAPDYLPTNLNQGIDLKRFQLNSDLTAGTTYAWRVRYRDHNQKWSEWSEEQTFTVSANNQALTDFTADITEGIVPFNVHFTDLSFPAATTWSWDFDADASIDATIQDPEFIYTQEGIFTVSLTTEHGTTIKDLYINAETNTVKEIENKTNDLVRIYPNPFFESSDIEFVLQKPEYVIIKIINNKGQEISVLNKGSLPSGKHSIHLKAYDNSGNKLAPGKYFLKFQAGEITEIKSLIITEK
jgi:PKD repeat protein